MPSRGFPSSAFQFYLWIMMVELAVDPVILADFVASFRVDRRSKEKPISRGWIRLEPLVSFKEPPEHAS